VDHHVLAGADRDARAIHRPHQAAEAGLIAAERLIAHYEHAEMMETHGALVNQRPDGSVVIEQPDGTRRWLARAV
jgi:hypothetical protein